VLLLLLAEASATGRPLIQGSPIECVSLCMTSRATIILYTYNDWVERGPNKKERKKEIFMGDFILLGTFVTTVGPITCTCMWMGVCARARNGNGVWRRTLEAYILLKHYFIKTYIFLVFCFLLRHFTGQLKQEPCLHLRQTYGSNTARSRGEGSQCLLFAIHETAC
jgi:hypothetical protein